MARGRFITFEGGDGTGKTTQVALLHAALERAGIAALATREPGGSPGAEAIRGLLISGAVDRWEPLTEAILHFAARRDHVHRLIAPALTRGSWVVSDRFTDSTVAYQGYGQGADRTVIAALARHVLDGVTPDLTLVLDLDPAVALERAVARAGNASRYERMDPAVHRRVREGFLAIAQAEPARCAVIDAAGDAEAVHRAVVSAVRARLAAPLAEPG